MQAQFNVTIIQPRGYVHSLALKEAADYVDACLRACGYESSRSVNHVHIGVRNIIFCGHLLDSRGIAALPGDSIIFNSEQLDDAKGWHFHEGVYRQALQRFTVWDYTSRNLAHIPHERKSIIPFAYRKELKRTDMARRPGRSLLFYGCVTERRLAVLQELKGHGIPVEVLFGEYAAQRDAKMLCAWAVLNLHKADDTQAFEPIRCFYPLINEVPVISEEVNDGTADAFRDSVFFFDQSSLVGGVSALYSNQSLFVDQSMKRLAAFQARSALPEVALAVERLSERPG